MKKFLPGFLIVVFTLSVLIFPQLIAAQAPAQQPPAGGAPAQQQQQAPAQPGQQAPAQGGAANGRTPPPEGLWVADPEVTFIGKNAARSGNLLDWTLRNYNWVCVKQAQTNAINQYQCDDTDNPLARFWLLIVSFIVVPLLFVVILATAIVIIITRGKSLTIMKFIPRFVAVIVLIVFSYSLLQFLYQFTDVIQGFFLRSDSAKICPPNCISQKDLLYVGWKYEDFVGLRLLHDYYAESAFMSLLLTKLTALTYFVMVGILLMRKIILWFFIIVSPIFPLLLLYYPVRNTGKIWIGEFFRWLLYAPLFAMFLNGLVYMWRQQIPLLFIPPQGAAAIGDKSQIIYPTAVNILLGGPKQFVTPDNSVNLTETFALYVVALIMLWVVILLPWILLQIFLDYASNFSPGESAVMKTLVNLAGNKKGAPPGGGGGATNPLPGGIGVAVPFTKKFQLPKGLNPTGTAKEIAGAAKEIASSEKETTTTHFGTATFGQATFTPAAQLNAQVLSVANVTLPTMRDIARYDSAQYSANSSQNREVSLAKETLQKIANPVAVTNTVEREKFTEIREKLTQESQAGNVLATSILNAANSSVNSQAQSSISTSQMQSILQQIANPTSASTASSTSSVVNRDKMVQLHDMLSRESKENNSQLASSLLSVSEKTSASEIEKIRDTLTSASNQSNSAISSVLSQIQSSRNSAENSREVKSVLTSIANPASVSNTIDRAKFSKLHDALEKESKENNNTLASSILQVSDKTTSEQIEKLKDSIYQTKDSQVASSVMSTINSAVSKQQQTTQVKSVLQQVANPASATSFDKQKLTKLQESLSKASKEGNDLATSVLKVSDKTSAADIEKIQEKINQAKLKGEPLATELASMTATKAAAPVVNRVQTVSKEDYDAVRSMWKDNYNNLEVPQGMAGNRSEWIKDDINKIDKIVGLLSSTDQEKVQEGMDEVGAIMPFLLMGGFSQTEIVAYLKAKQDAAKDVVASIASEEETQVSVGTQAATAEKAMHASFDTATSSAASSASASASAEAESESPLANISTTSTVNNFVTPEVSNDILAMVDLKLPKMRDVVRYETSNISKDNSKVADVQKMKTVLEKISNPASLPAGPDRERFEKLKEKLVTESASGNVTANVILQAANNAAAPVTTVTVKAALKQIAAPNTATTEIDKKRFNDLHTKLEEASKGGNELAASILKVNDKTSTEDIEKLKTRLEEAKKKGEPLATAVLSNAGAPVSLPSTNRLQQVSKEDFDEVKNLWKENYTNLEVPQGMAGSRAEWIKDDIAKIDSTIGLLTSNDQEKVKQGIDEVSNILPFLLIGGYSQDEIVSYLKAKQEAAKEVSASIATEEETQVSVGTQHAAAQQTMAAPVDTSAGDNATQFGTGDITASTVNSTNIVTPQVSNEILAMVNIKMPKLRDVVHYETRNVTKDTTKLAEFNKMHDVLSGIANPSSISAGPEREKFEKLHEKLIEESQKGNVTANVILNAASMSGDQKAPVIAPVQVKTVLQQIANPASAVSEVQKKRFTDLHDKLSKASQDGNEVAASLLAVKDTTPVEDIEKLQEKLREAKEKGDPVLGSVLGTVTAAAAVPAVNSLQQVTPEEYAEVKNLWKENYANLEVPQGMAGSRAEWIKDDIAKIDSTVKLLTSEDPEQVDKGIAEVSNILPFLLIGGYSQTEIVSYLKAKQEAAKEIIETITSEEDTKVSVTATKHEEAVQVQVASVETASPSVSESSARIQPQISNEILAMVNIKLPRIQDIARYEAGIASRDQSKMADVSKMNDMFKKITDPSPLSEGKEREQYQTLRNRLIEERQKGNVTADIILSAAESSQSESADLLKKVLIQIATPSVAATEGDKKQFTQLHDDVTKAKEKKVVFADGILAVTQATSKEDIEKIRTQLKEAKKEGDTLAVTILKTAGESISVPVSSRAQTVSPEDFDEVKKLWIENYKTLDVPQEFSNDAKGRIEWISKESQEVKDTINFMLSPDEEQREKGLKKVSAILPFLLLGGFSSPEMVAYLKAKLDAATEVMASVAEEENKSVTVNAAGADEKPKEMAASEIEKKD